MPHEFDTDGTGRMGQSEVVSSPTPRLCGSTSIGPNRRPVERACSEVQRRSKLPTSTTICFHELCGCPAGFDVRYVSFGIFV